MGVVRTALERTWVRAGLLLLVVLAGGAVALTVDLPSVDAVRGWLDDGARLVGGCCRVGPTDIRGIARTISLGDR